MTSGSARFTPWAPLGGRICASSLIWNSLPNRHKLTSLGIDRYLTRGENQPICFHGLGIRSNCIWSVFRLDDLLHSYDCLFFGCAKQRRDSIRNTQRRPKWTERIASFTQKSSVIEPALADGWK